MLQILSVHDAKTDAYIQPFFSPTTAAAERSFKTAVNDISTDICKYPEDYVLFHLGTFNPQTGQINVYDSHKHIANAITLKDS